MLETHLNIASCYQSIGKYDESILHLGNVLRINPKFTVADSQTYFFNEKI